ncbi:MAG: ABC transporter permease, partial [Candidatus Thorarchaeota archaeon]|nr:ABC transporter permease [Candidatus Thorarchaeota archaeon]
MNEEIIDNQDSVELKTTKKPIHLTIVSIGAFLLISLVLIVMMDMLITTIAQNLAVAHAGMDPVAIDSPIPAYVLAVRATAIICLAISITIGIVWKKIYLHRPGRILQKLLMVMICFMVFVMLGIGIGLIVTFALFFWDPTRLADWSPKNMKLYRYGILGTLLVLMVCEFSRVGYVTLMVMGLSSILLIIFGIFYWTPEISAGWIARKLLIYRILALSLIGVYAIVGWLTISSALSVYPMTPFLILTLSSILTPLGAGLVSLAPAVLVVIPLYLFLPKVIRDLWNLRPNIETFWREFLYHPMGILGVIIIGVIVCIALFAPYIAPYYWSNPPGSPILLDQLLQPPSPEHLLGTNHRGEDIFSRIIYGTQISLLIGFAASLVAVFLGTAVGLISGYFGGILDMILMRITDVFLCLPTLPLMLIFLMLFGQGLQNVIIVIAILGWT